MRGMLLKELYVSKSLAKSYLIAFVLFGVMAVTGVYALPFATGMFGVVLIMLPVSSFAYDEQAGWDKYAASTPAGRRGVVRGKYLFALVTWVVVAVFTLLIIWGIGVLRPEEGASENYFVGFGFLSAGLFLLCLLLPLLFKFGSQKSRVAMMIVTGITVGVIVGAASIFNEFKAEESLVGLIYILLPVLALGCLAISYFTSMAIYQKKNL